VSETLGKLAGAVCAVMVDVGYVQQTGKNLQQNYKYASDEDLLKAVQPAMAAHGLALLPMGVAAVTVEHAPTKAGGAQYRTEVEVSYLLVHTSGEWYDLHMAGAGVDGQDKGVYKALTGAYKYLLRQLFAIPTGEDAERDPPTAATRDANARAVASLVAPAAVSLPEGPIAPKASLPEGEVPERPEPAPHVRPLCEAAIRDKDVAALAGIRERIKELPAGPHKHGATQWLALATVLLASDGIGKANRKTLTALINALPDSNEYKSRAVDVLAYREAEEAHQ